MTSIRSVEEGYDAFWSGLRTSDDDWADEPGSLRRKAVAFVLRRAPSGEVLDMGCGDGKALRALSGRGFDLYGVDISMCALSSAKRYGEVLKADLARLPIRDRSFSCALVLDVFEHVVDKRLFMREVHRVLADSGLVVMTVPLPRATGGRGDTRQPYDVPLEFGETMGLVSSMFVVEGALGFPVMPLRSVSSVVEAYAPFAVGFALFRAFPRLFDRADEALLVLRKAEGTDPSL